MRIAIEAGALLGDRQTGISRYVGNIMRSLCECLMADGATSEVTALLPASRRRRRSALAAYTAAGLTHRSISKTGHRLCQSYDIVLCPHERLLRSPQAITVGVIYDLYAVHGVNFVNAEARFRQLRIYRNMAEQTAGLICISHSTRSEFLRYFDVAPSRVRVVSPGVGTQFSPRSAPELTALQQHYGLHRPFLLFVGLNHPNKNLPRLIEAFSRSRQAAGFELVIAGPYNAESAEALRIQGCISRHNLGARARCIGFVPDVMLPALYSAASAYLFPSIIEGFGLPILEAMRCGTPVLTSNVTSCPEAAGGHAVLVDPYCVEDIADGIDRVLRRTPAEVSAARQHAVHSSWDRCAGQMLQVLTDFWSAGEMVSA